MATEQEEVAGLDRVLMRLAMTDDDKLEKVMRCTACPCRRGSPHPDRPGMLR